MDKNTVIAIALSIIVIIVSLTIQTRFFNSNAENFEEQPIVNSIPTVGEINENNDFIQSDYINTPKTANSETPISERTDIIRTDLAEITFTNRGGDIVSFKLSEHKDKNSLVEMADGVTAKDRAFSVYFGDENSPLVDELFNVKIINDYTIGFYRNFSVTNNDGTESAFTFAKQYSFKPDDYMFELVITIDGDADMKELAFGNAGYTIATSPKIGPAYDPSQDRYEYRQFYTYINGKDKKIRLGEGKTERKTDKMSWAAVGGKYFAIAAVPEIPFNSVTFSTLPNSNNDTQSRMYLTRAPIRSNRVTDTYYFYVGPKTDKILSSYNKPDSNPYDMASLHLDEIVDTSSFWGWLETILKWIMQIFYYIIPNWGVSIILMTIFVKALFFPLTKKSSMATLKMQELQPKIQEIQEKYKNNPEKMNQEMAVFYQKAGYNPLSGCLPLLIQFPILFAMYNLFNNHFELRGAMFIPGWIPDLSQGDSILKLPFTVPILGWTDIRILPVIYVISQLIFGKITQTPNAAAGNGNGSMKIMMYGMPIFFFFMFYNAPAGLLLYWTVSNLLQMVQQKIINAGMAKEKRKTENDKSAALKIESNRRKKN